MSGETDGQTSPDPALASCLALPTPFVLVQDNHLTVIEQRLRTHREMFVQTRARLQE